MRCSTRRRQLVAVDAEPGADDHLLREAGERAVVLLRGERPAVLGEELAVHGERIGSSSESVPLKSKATARTARIGRFSLQPRSASGMLTPMLLAIDQGTTGTTCLVVDDELRAVGRGYREIAQHFPRPGWVEHDPLEIWESVLAATQRRPRRGAGLPLGADRARASRTSGRRRSSGSARTGEPVAARDRLAGPPDGASAAPSSRAT